MTLLKVLKSLRRLKRVHLHPTLYYSLGVSYMVAHDVLSNEELRRVYDRYGKEGVEQHEKKGGQNQRRSGFGSIFDMFGGQQQRGAGMPRGRQCAPLAYFF